MAVLFPPAALLELIQVSTRTAHRRTEDLQPVILRMPPSQKGTLHHFLSVLISSSRSKRSIDLVFLDSQMHLRDVMVDAIMDTEATLSRGYARDAALASCSVLTRKRRSLRLRSIAHYQAIGQCIVCSVRPVDSLDKTTHFGLHGRF